MWLPPGLPVTHSLPDGLEDAAARGQFKNCNEFSARESVHEYKQAHALQLLHTASVASYECDNVRGKYCCFDKCAGGPLQLSRFSIYSAPQRLLREQLHKTLQ